MTTIYHHGYKNSQQLLQKFDMDLSVTGRRQNREITGPTPHSVAIRGKPPPLKPREHLILERRKQDELREEAAAIVNYNKKYDLKTTWERMTDKRIQRNTVKRKMEAILQKHTYSLEERRDKLRDLLEHEEEQYMTEIATTQETTLERQAKMRERAKQLKQKREDERKAFVEQKLEQRWRDQCEEMRSILVKRNQDDVCLERAEQLRLKAEQRERQKQGERMYARMWEDDRFAKCKREEMEAALQIERNREALKVLTLQSAAIEKQHEDMKRLKEQEAELLREEAALRVLEDERMKEEKKRQQELTRAELNLSLRQKMKKKAREMQEELAMDMKLLQEMLQQTSNEDAERQQRKNELREEIKLYCEYLADQKKEEEKREKELNDMVTAEVEKQWSQRLAQWRIEKEARKKLMNDVMETRKKQIQFKMDRITEEKRETEREAKEIAANIARHHELAEQQKKAVWETNIFYQQDLLEQIKFHEDIKKKTKEEQLKELIMTEEAERLHQERVERALTIPDLTKTHPRKIIALGLNKN